MHKIIKTKFIKKYWFNIVSFDDGFGVVNTYRRRNMVDRDDIEKTIGFFKTKKEAEQYLVEYEKGNYEI